jgi:transcriptional regulator with XRE-family HTH domain
MLGLTQRQLGELVGVTQRQAYKCEHGVNGVSAGLLHVIAREMGVPLEYFFDGLEPDQWQPSPAQCLLLDVMRDLGDVQNEKYLEAITQLTRALAGR